MTLSGEHLAHEPGAAPAERSTHDQLTPALRRPRQLQIGDVRARQQQDQPRGSEHHVEQLSRSLAEETLTKPHSTQREALVGIGPGLLDLGRQDTQL